MKIEVEVTSKDIIKPSSSTLDHLRRYKLSFLDQVTVDVYNPMIYFYSPNDIETQFKTLDEVSNQLKRSLSKFLTHYYPLAGRANYDDFFIDCNDEGVHFFESRVNCQLSDFIHNSEPIDLNKLLPFELDKLSEINMGVQLNMFEYGGIALAICISHKIGDALSFFVSNNAWAALSRGNLDAVSAHFRSAELFPPRNSQSLFNTRSGITRDRVVKRFVVKASKVEAIRAKYAKSKALENERRPSRVEALSVFIYSRFLAAVKNESESSGPNKFYQILHPVNIRPRLDPPLPEYAFGNYYRFTMKVPSKEILEEEYCYGLVKEVRDDIDKINKELLKQFQMEEGDGKKPLETIKERSASFARGEMISCAFTSLCRFPLYDADFGWGKPIWVASPALTFTNLVVFIDTKDGDGIEVYIHLKEEHMAKLVADEEFLKYASLTV